MQCTELVPAVAAGVIQWARIHWPAEKICQSIELCDAATLTTTQARFTSLFVVHQAVGLFTLVIAACCIPCCLSLVSLAATFTLTANRCIQVPICMEADLPISINPSMYT